MAKTGTGPPEVVWRERWNLTAPSFLLHDTPNDLRTEAGSPDLASFIDRSKQNAGRNPRGSRPDVDSSFHPIRDWNGTYMPALAGKIGDEQCSSLCWMSSTRNVVNSARRSPQPSRIASVA
jgi:hypothetical protein